MHAGRQVRWQMALPLSTLIVVVVLFIFLPRGSSSKVHNALEICAGFSMTPVSEIPTAAIKAASAYLKTDMAVGVSSYALPVDPIRESSAPHKCLGVRDDMNPYGPNQPLTDRKDIAALAAKQRHYSGVIPPGATRALRISVLHMAPPPKYTGKDPAVIEYLNGSAPFTGSDLIVAYYPKRGWVGVFEFPAQGGWPAYP